MKGQKATVQLATFSWRDNAKHSLLEEKKVYNVKVIQESMLEKKFKNFYKAYWSKEESKVPTWIFGF